MTKRLTDDEIRALRELTQTRFEAVWEIEVTSPAFRDRFVRLLDEIEERRRIDPVVRAFIDGVEFGPIDEASIRAIAERKDGGA